MLRQRVITAVILVAILLPTLVVEAVWPFSLLSLAFISAAGWEWSRLNGAPGARAWLMAAAVAGGSIYAAHGFGLPVWQQPEVLSASQPHVHDVGHPLAGFYTPTWVWLVALPVWVVGGGLALRHGPRYWGQWPEWPRRVLGLVLLIGAWLALVDIKAQGGNFMLSVFCLVWAADIGAYFGGRAFGRRKLAPAISPGKSWEGVWSGMAAVLLLAVLWIAIDRHVGVDSPSLYSRLLLGIGPVGMVLALAFLAAMSVVGDLFESMIKRQAGAKDSSQLLPGHGGVLDRVDALLPVLPLSLALMSLCHA
ncbi:phosphatidate cytidylyltransferase [uncultured Aquabacterium sp.]|uniref:phosphatidate cytidylyltransferase n=1 Tax=Aquabacterium sp. TaxID=1872578 RepID=UPI0025F97DD6|nr:phosphatidate cytidylyltransferase [uncultured Aquabacterium sp.]